LNAGLDGRYRSVEAAPSGAIRRGVTAVWVEQAIFTSLMRHGRGGYHLVSRSKEISAAEAQAISTWSPSHGSLILDQHNRVSVNFHPLPSGRFALSRTCEGPPEYSGRGGRQLYNHILVLDDTTLRAINGQPLTLYHNALALGCLCYQPNPPERLEPIDLPAFHVHRDQAAWIARSIELKLPSIEPLRDRLLSGKAVRFAHQGNRALLAECLIGSLPLDHVQRVSFATSLEPSSVRPFMLSLVDLRNGK
jgi:hypothetical protein